MRLRHLAKKPFVQRMLGRLLLWYMRFAFSTIRWRVEIPTETAALFANKQPVLFAFWHGRLLLGPAVWNKHVNHTPSAILVSQHADGDYANVFLNHYQITPLRGSTSKGAVAGAIAVLKSLRAGKSVSLTVDGPRGPRMTINSGISRLATKSGKPIISFCYSTKWGGHAGSWDAMLLPLPFSKGVINFSKPQTPTLGAEEEMDQKLQNLMIDQQNQCDQLMERPLTGH